MSPPLPLHGGDLALARKRWGEPRDGWLDLSTGINPWPYPVPALAPELWQRLPDSHLDFALRQAAATRYGAATPDHVLAAGGSGALIAALPRLFEQKQSVIILGPTYREHQNAWAGSGHTVVMLNDPAALGDCTVLVAVTPNNPDGRMIDPRHLAAWAEKLAARGGLLVVDEAFMDLYPGQSVAGLGLPSTVVLRSFGKFYGLGGLRLGFAIAAKPLLDRLSRILGAWPVSGPAMEIGRMALEDEAWATRTRAALKEQTTQFHELLSASGLHRAGGTDLFTLIRHADAHSLWDRLGRGGILTRAFAHDPGLLRVGLPGSDEDMDRLGAALAES